MILRGKKKKDKSLHCALKQRNLYGTVALA